MEYKTFDQILQQVKTASLCKRMAVAVAEDPHTLEAALNAEKEGIAQPIYVGDKEKILKVAADLGATLNEDSIYHQSDKEKACQKAVALVREGKADFLMKGLVDTSVLLKQVVEKTSGLNTGRLMSHFTIFQIPSYHKLLTIVDGGMIPYPTLNQKKDIINNTVEALRNLGYTLPKVGIVTCVEKLNPKMPETVEADLLAQMNRERVIKNCLIDGPISYDCALSKEVAEIKEYKGEVAGNVDVLVAPNIHTGNIMGKMLTITCNAKMAGIVVGAACPIVLASRGASLEEKYLSILLSAATV